MSSTEAEYKAIVTAACEAIWLRRILTDIGLHQEEATKLLCDNQSVLKIAKNPVFHAQTKHIKGITILSWSKFSMERLSLFTDPQMISWHMSSPNHLHMTSLSTSEAELG